MIIVLRPQDEAVESPGGGRYEPRAMGGPCLVDGVMWPELDNFIDTPEQFVLNGERSCDQGPSAIALMDVHANDNRSVCPANGAGKTWTNVEQFFQAAKFPDDEAYQERIRSTCSGHECWKLGHAHFISESPTDEPQPLDPESEPSLEQLSELDAANRRTAATTPGSPSHTGSSDEAVSHSSSSPEELMEHHAAVEKLTAGFDGGAYNCGRPTPTWWQVAKVDVMYRCNMAKFQQNLDFQRVLLGGRGPITAYGAPFWAKWNSIILECIREELRPEDTRDESIIATAKRWMNEYREAALVDDQYKIEVRPASLHRVAP